MGDSISNKLQSLLDEYCGKVDGVLGLGISTSDGLEISSHFNEAVDTMMAHAVSSSIYNYSQFSARKLGFDRFKLNMIYTDEGIIALKKVSNNKTLLVIMTPEANVGLALLEMDNFVNRINVLI